MDTSLLENRDFDLLIDRSGSMSTCDCAGLTRWETAYESTVALANKVQQFDKDGIGLYFFNHTFKKFSNVTSEKVVDVWKEVDPMGGTRLAVVLKDAINAYFSDKANGTAKANGKTILVITDGEPEDKEEIAKLIVASSKKMDRDEELSITFIQVGKDYGAAKFLKRLDDDLQKEGAKFDIVDTVTMDELGERSVVDVLLSSITD